MLIAHILLFTVVLNFGNVVKSCCTSMILKKYYGYIYVTADNVKSKYELSKVSEPNEITSL